MAIYHFTAKIVSRSRGQSAVAKAAYNAREKMTDERTGERYDYQRKGGIVFSGIFAPKDAPEWVQDRQALWNEAERSEKRKNSQLAREVEIALPHELTDKQREFLVRDYVRENFVRHGMVADVSIHAPDKEGDGRNHHAHILLTLREIGPDGFGAKLRDFNSKKQLEDWREKWEHLANRHLERHGHDARIDRRTLEAQGIDREPTRHQGPTATQLEREGVKSELGDKNRTIEERNRQRAQLKTEKKEITNTLESAQGSEAEKQAIRYVYKVKTAADIRAAWEASPDGIDFMMALNERGLHVTHDEKGHYAAVADNGFAHRLNRQIYGKAASEMRTGLDAVQQSGVIIPSIEEHRDDLEKRREEQRQQCRRELEQKEKQRAGHLGATLYDRADMVSMQQDATRHMNDAHRVQERTREQRERERARQERDALRRDPGAQAREDKKARTEQTDSKQRKAQREALLVNRPGREGRERGDETSERERERER